MIAPNLRRSLMRVADEIREHRAIARALEKRQEKLLNQLIDQTLSDPAALDRIQAALDERGTGGPPVDPDDQVEHDERFGFERQ